MKRETGKQLVIQYGIITLACAFYAVGFNWCFEPNHLSVGGFTGIAQILHALIPQLPIGVLLCAFSRGQIVTVKTIVKEADPDAFVIVCDAYEVLGEGFGVNMPDGL